MSHRFRLIPLIVLLGASASLSHAAGNLKIFLAPDNYALTGLSSGGAWGVSINSAGNVLYNGAAASPFSNFSGNSSAQGFSGGLSVSADGRSISGAASTWVNYGSGNVERSQAARYDVTSGTWTTLGSLGNYSNSAPYSGATVRQESAAYGMSSDGQTVVGSAYWKATGPGTTATATHAVVFRDGRVIDLSPGSNSSGRALAISGNGNIVAGYTANSTVSSIWRWNGSNYIADATPTITANVWQVSPTSPTPTLNTVTSAFSISNLSDNGKYGAGGSVNAFASIYSNYLVNPTITYSPATLWNTETQTGKLIPFDHVIDTSPGGTDLVRNTKATVVGVSDSGVVIGTFNLCLNCSTGIFDLDTWIYDDKTGVSKSFDSYLNEQLGGNSFGAGAGQKHVWSLASMSADGSAISGYYFDKTTNQTAGFLLNISAVPEPSSYAMLGLGLAFLACARRGQRRHA